ncbi:MAG: arginine decarboxylase [Clostridia bacterium]|jgi:arginine/lysine/ornithine decarboxylase|nr:arginine decarboxylase [Clostridia bacterium]
MLKKAETPLLDQLNHYIKTAKTGFHTPGHQQEKGFDTDFLRMAGNYGLLKMDLTELEGLDDLRAPAGCLAESQRLTAELFDADQTFYLVNGSTVGLQAALLAVNKPGEKIMMPRHAHVSAMNGLVLSGGIPVFIPAEIDKEWGFPLGVSPDRLKAVQQQHSEATSVLWTNPEYRGTGADISRAIKYFQTISLTTIVDEAHGAHLYFQDDLPLSAQRLKPDITVQSAHKTLPVFTQASLLHLNNTKWTDRVQTALCTLQTTSPSYLLLASLDAMQGQLRLHGRALFDGVLAVAETLRAGIQGLAGYRVYAANEEQGWYQDKTKVLVSAAELGLSGWELEGLLHHGHGIRVEMSDYFYVLFLVHFGHTEEDARRVLDALETIRRNIKRKPLAPCPISVGFLEHNLEPPVSPREVFFAPKELVGLKDAAGRIAGEAWALYPPGIPLVQPGEIISLAQIEYILEAKSRKNKVQGIRPNDRVSVLVRE